MIDKAVEQVKTTMTIFCGNKKSKTIFIKVKEDIKMVNISC